jgi:hypothetical protein
MRVDSLTLTNLEDGRPTYVYIAASAGEIACSVILAGSDDIEFAFGTDDCKAIISMLEEANRSNLERGCAQDGLPHSHSHGFKNLDGGETAAFTVSGTNNLVALTLERSDEGNLAFRISLENTGRLIDTLKKALELALSLARA